MGTKTQIILQALADVDVPVRLEHIVGVVGDEDDRAEARASAMLGYLVKRGLANSAGRGAGWVITQLGREHLHDQTRDADAASPPPRKAARATKRSAPLTEHKAERAPRKLAALPAPRVKPPGSVAVADDGTVLLIEGDRIAARITAQQAANIAALVSRYQAD